MFAVFDELDEPACQSDSVLERSPGKPSVSLGTKQIARVQFESGGWRTSQIIADQPVEFLPGPVPAFVTKVHAAEHHYWLLGIIQVPARISGFVEVEEMHAGSLARVGSFLML
jgi:hypothetical protein